MLPPTASSKRNAYHNRHPASYHPYYSSSPLVSGNQTNNTPTQVHSNLKRNDHEEENYLDSSNTTSHNTSLTNTPNSKFNVLSYSACRSINTSYNNSDQEVSSEFNSNRNTPTGRPPTTPVSSNNCNNSLNLDASPQNILFVTPATASSAASSIVVNKLNAAIIPSTTTSESSSSSSVYSSAVATYSRSSSMTSLSSFDIKSTHSSIPSEYSVTSSDPYNNIKDSEDMYSTKYQGCFTPTTYGELPSSPGELFPCNNLTDNPSKPQASHSNFFYQCNNSAARFNKSVNEISVLTVDSNPSRSNDITIIERTVVASHSNTHSHNNTHLTGSGGVGTTFIYNPDETTDINNEQPASEAVGFEEDKVISYDMEGSLYSASRSNVSGLTFPNEPAADLAFIRSLLTRKSAVDDDPKNNERIEELFKSMEKEEKLEEKETKKYQWSGYTTKQFTPPVKLATFTNESVVLDGRANKKLFADEEDEVDEIRSIASLPSELAFDRSTNVVMNKQRFNALFNKLDRSNFESSPNVDDLRKVQYIQSQSFRSDLTFNSPANFTGLPKTETEEEEEECDEQMYCSYAEPKSEQSDSDEQFLNDFINEMLPNAGGVNSSVDIEEADEEREEGLEVEEEQEEEEVDFEQEQHMKKYLAERNVFKSESENVQSRILPKIDEVNEDAENECESARVCTGKPVKRLSLGKSVLKPGSVSVHMTRTALLRENKIKLSKQLVNSGNPKRTNLKNDNNENVLNMPDASGSSKRVIGKFSAPTKSSAMKTSGQAVNSSIALGSSNKVNKLKACPRNTVK